ncbi:MAG TPA: hypothetical protein VG204_16070 [Terriglobia bacterium]|nr:hypothetical protein [Terriglobia bacterium]
MSAHVTGLEILNLTEVSFRRLGTRQVRAFVHLRTYDVTPDVQKLPIPNRFKYMVARAKRWVDGLCHRYPGLSLQPFAKGNVMKTKHPGCGGDARDTKASHSA